MESKQPEEILLVYWPFRGRGEAVRKLMEYLGIKYKNKALYSFSDWITIKNESKAPFINLPYIIDGDRIISETESILVYLCFKGKRPDLVGRNATEMIRIRAISSFINDFISQVGSRIRSPAWEIMLKEYEEDTLSRRLQSVSDFLGDHTFLAGDQLSYIDFLAFEGLNMIDAHLPGNFERFPKVMAYLKRFEEIREIADYIKSPRYIFKNRVQPIHKALVKPSITTRT